MAKRKIPDDGYSTGSGDSESSASTWKPSKERVTSRRRRPKQKRKAIQSDSDSGDYAEDQKNKPRNGENQHPTSRHLVTSPTLICAALLDWYAGVHDSRGMPWRQPYNTLLDPNGRAQRAYEVWISEIMLQQTQVATVIPYYNRWMKKFPTIVDLAASDIEVVNSLWKGLGYYSRAARLLKGAQKAVKELGGRLPDNATDMKAKIPGIGRYSAGAICSIAYNQNVPVLDGNVHRLLSRFLALHAPPKAKATLDILWSGATTLVENTDRPGDLNQALIECGSTVCKVHDPACPSCPLRSWCKAYQHSEVGVVGQSSSGAPNIVDIEDVCTLCDPLANNATVTSYPMKVERKNIREELDVVNVVEWRHTTSGNRQFLLVRRPEGGLLAGLHEFPTMPDVSRVTTPNLTNITQQLLSWLLLSPPYSPSEKGKQQRPPDSSIDVTTVDRLRITKTESAGDVVHVFSHIKKTYRLQWVVMEGGNKPPSLNPQLENHPGKAKAILRKESKKKGKGRKGSSEVNSADSSTVSPISMWVPLHKVAEANIGSGVLKVWNQVKTLWEG